MKTLLVLATHFIDENVISEYRKMKNTPNVDAVLMIDNTNLKMDFQSRIEDKIFSGTTCKCFFFDSALNDEMQLPYFTFDGIQDFSGVMYHNGDYRFYYFKKFFPNYDYYWMFDYDVFCNSETYAGFLEKFKHNHADLIINGFGRAEQKAGNYIEGINWLYNDLEKVYKGVFAVVRLSARAIDFLYKRRLEHKETFQSLNDKDNHWILCEVFVPTELFNSGFICENLNEDRVRFLPQIYLNDERFFLKPDNHLYHPVKSVKAEISKRDKQYDDLFFRFRKNFFIHLSEILNSNFNQNIFQLYVDKDFKVMVVDLTNNGGGKRELSCEIGFLLDRIYATPIKVCAVFIFEGEYIKYFKILKKCIDLNQIPPVEFFENPTNKMLTYSTSDFDNVLEFAKVIGILIEMILAVLQEKNL